MSKSKVVFRSHHGGSLPEDTIFVSESVMKRWRIPESRPVQLQFGSASRTVHVTPTHYKSEMRVHPKLAEHFGLLHGATLRLEYKPSGETIRIGPLIGIMIPTIRGESPGRRFGSISSFCREIAEASRNQGAFVYFFTPRELRSTDDGIPGWAIASREYQATFPIPDVIHNRLTSRKLDNLPSVKKLVQDAKEKYNASVFNEAYLDKTEVFTALRKSDNVVNYLPESHTFRGLDQLKSFCGKYRSVFLKPATGSLGKGIIRIVKTASGYEASYASLNGVRRKTFGSLAELYKTVSSKARVRRYQIQQGIPLISSRLKPVDFRALVQKNLQGKWRITSIVARIAGQNRFVSNVAQGGAMRSVRTALAHSNLSPGARASVYSKLKSAAIRIAKSIDQTIPHHFGELGIDLAVDPNGKVWLLEVNSKPSKNDGTYATGSKIRPSVTHLVQYSRFLAGL